VRVVVAAIFPTDVKRNELDSIDKIVVVLDLVLVLVLVVPVRMVVRLPYVLFCV